MTERRLALIAAGTAAGLALFAQTGMAAAQTSVTGTATNRTALGVPEQDAAYCAPKADGTPGDCTTNPPPRSGAVNPASIPVLLGAVGAVGLGVAAAASGGNNRRSGAPVSP